MAEHEEQIFEHELKAKFEQLDAQIKIPEIPDAQSIFERANEEKGRVIPFKKYSRYIAVAAAVALICVSIPVVGVLGSRIEMDAASNEAAPESYSYSYMDEVEEEAVQEAPQYPEAINEEVAENETKATNENEADSDGYNSAANDTAESGAACSLPLDAALRVYFTSENYAKKDIFGIESPDVEAIAEDINKKRSIEIAIEDGSVSVILTDNEIGEAIAFFWVEGYYTNSYFDKETGKYMITVAKPITIEEFEGGHYLPAVSDALLGSYTVSSDAITVSGSVAEGIITLYISINPGTGEYEITGEIR